MLVLRSCQIIFTCKIESTPEQLFLGGRKDKTWMIKIKSTVTPTCLSIIKLNNKQLRSTPPLRTPGKVTGVFLAAANPEKLQGASPAPPHCLASSSLCLERKVSGWQSFDLPTNLAASVGWSHLEVQVEGVDHCQQDS